MILTVVTPHKSVINTVCNSVILPGFYGEFQILSDHCPFMAILKPGIIIYDNIHLRISSGYVELYNNSLFIVCEEIYF